VSTVPPFLTDDEILQIVRPLVQPAAIMRWFRKNGFADLKPRPNGLPLVPRTRFDAPAPAAASKEPSAQPNIDGFNAKYGNKAKIRVVK